MPGSRERCDICLIGAGRDKQAGGPAPRPLLSSSFASGLRRCIQIAAIFAALSLSPAATAGGAAPLASYLRQDGTQLDLRGADVVDEDLAVLDESVFSRVASVLLARTRVGDRGLKFLRNLRVRQLDLYLTAVTDKGLEHLRGLPIERLDMTGTAVGDTGLEQLGRLPLAILVLRETKVTSAGLRALRDLPLRHLDLSHTAVTDGGLVHLKGLRELRTLDLSDTPIGDAGLSELSKIPDLATVYLVGTNVTPAGLAGFKSARPEVRVYADRPVR